MSPHDIVASNYPTETMVKAARTLHFSIPKPPAGRGTGSSGSHNSPWLAFNCSAFHLSGVAKVAMGTMSRKSRLPCTTTSNSAFQTIVIFAQFENHF